MSINGRFVLERAPKDEPVQLHDRTQNLELVWRVYEVSAERPGRDVPGKALACAETSDSGTRSSGGQFRGWLKRR
jgi:hypothetical protein